MNQQQVHENHEMSHALYEDLAALKIRIAFAEISEAELDEYDRELSSVSEADYSEAAQKKALKLIERKLNKQLSKRFIRRTLPRSLQIVTVALLLFFIGLTTAIATVRPIRLRILAFIAQIDESYSAVGMTYNDNDNSIVPDEWKGKYYPYYIPDEYEFSHVEELFNIAYYAATDDCILQFSEYENTIYSNINIDQDNVFDVTINGNAGIAMTSEDVTKIAWCVDDTYLYLCFSGDFDEAERIAESVRRIDSSQL